MQPLVILGNGNFAVEAADLASDVPDYRVDYFVQSVDPQAPTGELEGLPVLWVETARRLAQTHWAVCAIGTPQRRAFIEMAASYGFRFATLIHPTARVSLRSSVGEGSIVSAGAVIAAHTRVGRHVIVNRGALIGHHCAIGDYSTLGPGSNVGGCVFLGEQTFVGIGALVSDHITIGERCSLPAGAVITTDLGDDTRAPMRRSRPVPSFPHRSW